MMYMNRKYRDYEWFHEKYVEEELTNREIADICGVSGPTICRWKKRHGIESRGNGMPERVRKEISDTLTGKMTGEDHPFYGETHDEEARQKISKAKSGENHPFYGESRPEFSEKMEGENNPSWKGGVTQDLDFRKSNKWKKFSKEKKEDVDWTCENCGSHGSESNIHTHHAEPVAQGGDKWDNTFIVLCEECHYGDYDLWHNSTVEEQLSQLGDLRSQSDGGRGSSNRRNR